MPKFVAGPTEFKRDHEEWWLAAFENQEPAAKIPIDLRSYKVLCKCMGCRNTKRGVSRGKLAPKGGAPAQSKVTKKPAGNLLPADFTRRRVQRKAGASAGKWDTYFFGPSGTMYRSMTEVHAAVAKK